MKRLAFLITLCLLLMPAAAMADTSVDIAIHNSGGQSGTWIWGGAPFALFGSSGNLKIEAGSDFGGAVLTGSVLTWETGTPSVGSVLGASFASSGSSINISAGSVCSTDCFTGTFLDSQMLNSGVGGLVFESKFVVGNLDPVLLGLLGLDPSNTGYVGVFSANLKVGTCPTGPQTVDRQGLVCGTWKSGDLSLTAAPVPEPGSLALFGTGLLGVAGFLRRKLMSR